MTFVERDAVAVRELRARLVEWGAQGGQVEHGDALRFLAGTAECPYDLVFLDPPFASGLLADSARALEERQWLSPGARIYVEADAHAGLPLLPRTWRLMKTKEAGSVGYHLLARGEGE